MSVFADSSALVKLYADEAGSEEVRDVEATVVSQICRVEVPAAIWRKCRIEEIRETDARILVEEFEADFFGGPDRPPRFLVVGLVQEAVDHAARLTGTHALRAYDAVQLASALAARTADPGCGVFACFDEELRTAAAAEGFSLLPAT